MACQKQGRHTHDVYDGRTGISDYIYINELVILAIRVKHAVKPVLILPVPSY